MIVVDSSVWIDHFTNRTEERAVQAFRAVDDPTEIVVGDIVMIEVLRGAQSERHAARLAAILETFRIERMLDPDLARVGAHHYRRLRAAGVTIPTVPDLVIAAYCIDQGHHLLTKDRDFLPFAEHFGLRLL